MVREGIDPLVEREAQAAQIAARKQASAVQAITFKTVATAYIEANEVGWRNAKHREQWRSTLETYAYPHMGDLPVGEVATAHVMAALEAIWKTKPEIASRVRGRIESVLDYARAREWRTGETRHAGADISPTCSQHGERRRASSTTLPSLGLK